MNFYSEYGEDRWIAQSLPLPERGVYLDVGAGHPEQGSNTAFLRDRGWRGLAIDAVESYGPHWIGRQQFVCALLSSKQSVRFNHVRENSCISRITEPDDPEGRERNAVPLEYVLGCLFKAASPPITAIDLMSLDIEGHEFDVFNTFDWRAWRPAIIIAEYSTQIPVGGVKSDYRLRDLLIANGYRVVHQTVANFIFQRQ